MKYIVGVVIGIFLVFLLLFKNKNKSDWVLLTCLLALSFHLVLFYLDASGKIGDYSFLIGVSIPFPVLHGPFLYTYTSLLLSLNKKRNYYLLHFIPFLLLNLILIPFYSLPTEEKLYIFQNEGFGYEKFVLLNIVSIFLSGVVYCSLNYVRISKYKKQNQPLSQNKLKRLKWLQFLTFGLIMIWIFVFVGNNEFIFTSVVLFIISLGIFGVQQNSIFSNPTKESTLFQSTSKQPKYEKSGLTIDKKTIILEQLERLIIGEKLYLNPELSLNELAKHIQTQPNYLSQVINEHFSMNFYDFLNRRRVEEFCVKINTNEFKHYKLIEVAYECGFNSKSSFNRNFKRFVGKTPSEYKKEL